MSLGFQVGDVQKPLGSVWRIADQRSVNFGFRAKDERTLRCTDCDEDVYDLEGEVVRTKDKSEF